MFAASGLISYNESSPMLDKILHRWLRIPYTLHVRHKGSSKSSRTTVVFIHGIGSNGDIWQDAIDRLPTDTRVLSIDLLGFGESPRPDWALYNAQTQARAIMKTLFVARQRGPYIFIGHSLGGLVASEIAKRYPLLTKGIVICNPPLYDTSREDSKIPSTDKLLRSLYRNIRNYPDQFLKLSAFATKYKLVNKSFNVTKDNFHTYVATLEAAIINQSTYDDLQRLKVPVHIIRGSLDPVVNGRPIQRLTKRCEHITSSTVIAGHEITRSYVKPIVSSLEAIQKS